MVILSVIGAVLAASAAVYLLLLRTYITARDEAGAIGAFERLLGAGYGVISDPLGEFTRTPEDADRMAEAYAQNIRHLAPLAARHPGKVAIAVKPTAIGVGSDEGATRRAERICWAARATGVFVWFDAETRAVHMPTHDLVTGLARRGFRDLGLAIQSMYTDASWLLLSVSRLPISVRLVKGAYAGDGDTKDGAAIAEHLRRLIHAARSCYDDRPAMVATGSCDETVIREAGNEVERQFLWGVRPNLAARLLAEGRRVTVYCPFGDLKRGHGYFMRRLREGIRWSTLWLFVRNILEARRFRRSL